MKAEGFGHFDDARRRQVMNPKRAYSGAAATIVGNHEIQGSIVHPFGDRGVHKVEGTLG